MKSYQVDDEEELLAVTKGQNTARFSLREFFTAAVLLSLATILSFVAFSDSSHSLRTTFTSGIASRILTLEDIPRDTIYGNFTEDDQSYLFSLFMEKYNKAYTDDEYEKRFAIFKKSLAKADVRNSGEWSRGGTARHGITKFSDMSESEFKDTILVAKKPNSSQRERGVAKMVRILFNEFTFMLSLLDFWRWFLPM
jgi:hypothetical protein